MSAGWLLMSSRFIAAGVWLLGGSACVLVFLTPGNGAIIGVIAAIVVGALRLPVHHGAIAAIVLGGLFVLAHTFATNWSELTGVALSGVGLAFAYMATASVRRMREDRARARALLDEL
jgi:hypothetical protein